MEVLAFLIPIALVLGGLGLVAFIWSLKSGQFEDLDGAAMRILNDDDTASPKRNDDQAAASSRGRTKSTKS
jgi:cbb3-type cytochrome oxidase maturation protein